MNEFTFLHRSIVTGGSTGSYEFIREEGTQQAVGPLGGVEKEMQERKATQKPRPVSMETILYEYDMTPQQV